MLVWLSVWRKVQMVCVWSSWCHCIPKPHHILPDSNPDWQNVPEHFSSSVLRKKTYKTPQNVSVHVTAKSNRQYGHTSKSNVFSTSCLIWSGVVMCARVSWCLHTYIYSYIYNVRSSQVQWSKSEAWTQFLLAWFHCYLSDNSVHNLCCSVKKNFQLNPTRYLSNKLYIYLFKQHHTSCGCSQFTSWMTCKKTDGLASCKLPCVSLCHLLTFLAPGA